MKDRVSAKDVPPDELLLFDGRGSSTCTEWVAAFGAWCSAREAWEAEHPGVTLPEGVTVGECPDDLEWLLLHSGVWSRPAHSDGPVVCAEHGLRPDEH